VFPDPNEAKKPKKAGWAQSDSEEESTHPSANGNGNGSTKSSGSQQRSAPAIDATIAPAAQPALLTHDGMPRGALTPLTPPTPFDLTQMPEGFGATSNGAGTAHYDTTNGEQLPLGDSFSDMHMRGHSALGFDISASGLDMGGVHAHSHAYAAAASAAAAALGAAAVEEVKDKWAAGHGHTPILNAPNCELNRILYTLVQF
jgi:hypothetical protein